MLLFMNFHLIVKALNMIYWKSYHEQNSYFTFSSAEIFICYYDTYKLQHISWLPQVTQEHTVYTY